MEFKNTVSPATFDEVLEAIDHLKVDEQAELLSVVKRRMAAHRRGLIASDIQSALTEFESRDLKPASVEEIIREIES